MLNEPPAPCPPEKFARDGIFEMVKTLLHRPDSISQEILRLQNYLYDTLIYTADSSCEDALIATAAEVYHYQILLNHKIGRTCFVASKTDDTLLYYVHSEMSRRIPQMKDLPLNAEFSQRVMAVYRERYVKAVPADPVKLRQLEKLRDYLTNTAATYEGAVAILHGPWSPPDISFKKYITSRFLENKFDPADPDKKRLSSIDSMNQFYKQLEMTQKVSFLNDTPTEKDMLYIICIALGFGFDDFCRLRSIIQKEKQDSSLCADNHLTRRDQLIQSVLSHIDRWYETVKSEHNHPLIEWMPQLVLQRVDAMLAENGLEPLYAPRRTRHQKTKLPT